jgi:acetyl-CoA carboxylase biotin carboxyl carrier protein
VTLDNDALRECVGITADQLQQVVGLLAGSDITELDLTVGAARLSVRRSVSAVAPPPVAIAPVEAQPLAIASPLVGIFRAAVGAGETVELGQSIGAIEALGMPTSVDAPHSGTVEQVLVSDGSPVEYGEPLLVLRRAD